MSKPLEPTIYPPSDGLHKTFIGGFMEGYCLDCRYRDKRLTDAELAAEYQNSRLVSYVRHRRVENYPGDMTLFDHYERGLEQEWWLERFATLPHYDEAELRK